MKEELSLQCPYKVYLDTYNFIYSFTTKEGAEYDLYFDPQNEIFTSTSLENEEVFHVVLTKQKPGNGGKDKKVFETVDSILTHFFEAKDRILIYSCDTSDGRHFTRQKIFDSWFYRSDLEPQLRKIEGIIIIDDSHYISSMIFHVENSKGEENVANAYKSVMEILQESKEVIS